MPFLSVIIPVYNVSAFLPHCLDSILNQTFSDLEIICIENNSTDNSPEILQEYIKKDARLRVFHQPIQGQSDARNLGLEKAQGQYIGFVDSDDSIDVNYYQQLCQAAINTHADVICTGYQSILPGQEHNKVQWGNLCECNNWEDRWKVSSAVWDKIYKRNFIEKNAIRFPTATTWEDVLWVLKIMYMADTIFKLTGNGYFYTINPNGTISSSLSKNHAKTLRDIKTVYKLSQDFIFQKSPSFFKRQIMNEFLVHKLFFDQIIQEDPSLLRKISWLTNWKRKRDLLLQKYFLCCIQKRKYHEDFYYVWRLFGLKIRLWKADPNTENLF